ncbi:FAD/NAD(P)-binding domain-containing protein [Coprinopsis marcescibilis]|uniref:FAD/NAD(P)-binding domain-containing protein n=1 Tax=Coprinopsis marcescibilis TaxID=230819 RepID=A0A5C3LCL2_COPMA|nr:FAD/NAD(P)-binding domain-containing protein [Coprinopsis marcescibilis]
MVFFQQLIWGLITLDLSWWRTTFQVPQEPKSIAIVGAGSAGLAVLERLLKVSAQKGQEWDVTLYEQTDDVGGVWLPDTRDLRPPEIPYSPLYPLLRTNTPVPSMTYPGFPFQPGTPLYPTHEHIQEYHRQYASHRQLFPHIKFQHSVVEARWIGSAGGGAWNITFVDHSNMTRYKEVNHLVVASGNHHIPHIPRWPGQEEWLEHRRTGRPQREILHSVYYRRPEKFTARTLLIIGSSASAQDAAVQTVKFTKTTYISVRHEIHLPPGSDDVVTKPDISHFTPNSVVFADGTEVGDVDSVLVATGYEQRKPFLESGGALTVDPSAHSNSSSTGRGGTLVTNLRYIFPLHQHIFSLSPEYPVNALAFIGLPTRIANCPSDFAQGLFVAHAIANGSILPGREELLGELALREEKVRKYGYDPYTVGHEMVNGTSSDYQDELVDFLQKTNAIPKTGAKYVENWRRYIFDYAYLKRGWKRIEQLGEGDKWVKGIETEEQWSSLMRRVNEWQQRYEEDNGVPFVQDMVIGG